MPNRSISSFTKIVNKIIKAFVSNPEFQKNERGAIQKSFQIPLPLLHLRGIIFLNSRALEKIVYFLKFHLLISKNTGKGAMIPSDNNPPDS